MYIVLQIFLVYLILINIISVIVTIVDKVCAIKHIWRVRERTLLILSAVGGSVSMFVTMQIIRHKTRHLKFMLGIPAIFIVQCLIAFVIWRVVNG